MDGRFYRSTKYYNYPQVLHHREFHFFVQLLAQCSVSQFQIYFSKGPMSRDDRLYPLQLGLSPRNSAAFRPSSKKALKYVLNLRHVNSSKEVSRRVLLAFWTSYQDSPNLFSRDSTRPYWLMNWAAVIRLSASLLCNQSPSTEPSCG